MDNSFFINSEILYNVKNKNGIKAENICMSPLFCEIRFDDKGEKSFWAYNKERTFELQLKYKYRRIGVVVTFDDNTNIFSLFDENNKYHWYYLFKDFLHRSTNVKEDKFWYQYLLVSLCCFHISAHLLLETLEIIKKECLKEHFLLLLDSLKRYAKFSSESNQLVIKEILNKYGIIIELYIPKTLREGCLLLNTIRPQKRLLKYPNKVPLFYLLHNIEWFRRQSLFWNDNEPLPWEKYTEEELENLKKQKYLTREKYVKYPFIYILYWIDNNEEILQDYSILEEYYSFYSKDIQIEIIRRYFYDVKQCRTSFSINVLKKIVYNHYREYEDYLYILRGDEKQDKSIELCLECIENYIATNGAQLQTLNGIIDLTIRESNYIAPQVSFDMMSSLLQNCQGGLLQNIQFKGFGRMIGYYQLDYKTLSTESLYSIHKNFINLYTRIEIETIAEGYPDIDMETGIQKIDKNGKPLFVPMSTKKRTIIKGYEDIINIFGCVSEEESDYSLVEKRLKGILSRYDIHKNNDNEWQIDIVNQDKIIEIIVNNFLKPTKYLFTFNDKISIGNNLPFSMTKDEVKNNIVNYLQPFIINQLDENNYEIQCSKEELEKIKVELRITSIQKNTHTKGKQNEPNDEYIFLKREHQRSLCYCNPSVNKSKHSILGRKFLWCERKPCYYSCIRYNESPKNLIDFLHILNHDIVIDSQCAGLIPNRVYSQFMDQLNKSITIYEAMICKECGHILFPQKKGRGYYYYYACKNEKCSNHGKWIYLNNCYKCGANIDSRTTNKCPNGIHICPHCLTCCSDDHFKRLKKNQIAEYGESTPWIDERQGKGHNDKGKYFCPKCGKELSHEKECYNCHYQHKEE